MISVAGRLCMALGAALLLTVSSHQPASAITPDLAKKCRQMAINKHPIPRPDKKPEAVKARHEAAKAHHEFYRDCVAKDGKI